MKTKNSILASLLLILVLIGLMAPFDSGAQTNSPPATNATITVREFLLEGYDTLFGQGTTNLDVAVVETYTPSLKKWGSGLLISRNIPIGDGVATGLGFGVDYYDKNFYALSGQVSLKADLQPFVNNIWLPTVVRDAIVTPFTYIGLGTPFGNNSTSSSGVEAIAATGLSLHLAHVIGGDLSLIGTYGTRAGLGVASGVFYGGGLNMLWTY